MNRNERFRFSTRICRHLTVLSGKNKHDQVLNYGSDLRGTSATLVLMYAGTS